MQRLAIYTTADGAEVAVQVADDVLAPGVTLRGGGGGGALVERTQQNLDDVLANTRPAVRSLLRQLREHEDAPDELEVEFGIQVSLEVGAFIASADSSANFKVTMRWHRPPS
ncbi:CU044_2847 family protein [Agromyces sp. SYSU T0242]|uniref:CU044_2847 family protein n=1 Tax=Agromyces litoreus TaxID=3158561 RepID=UPI00339588CD